jgi:hypothetical protein
MSITPPWGTPQGKPLSTAPSPTYGDPYPGVPEQLPGPAAEPGSEPAGWFYLLVEQLTGSGEAAVWRIEPAPIPAGASRQDARAAALDLARTFRPKHPFSPRSRGVFRVDDDTLMVIVEGATKTFHFRVTVAEYLG